MDTNVPDADPLDLPRFNAPGPPLFWTERIESFSHYLLVAYAIGVGFMLSLTKCFDGDNETVQSTSVYEAGRYGKLAMLGTRSESVLPKLRAMIDSPDAEVVREVRKAGRRFR